MSIANPHLVAGSPAVARATLLKRWAVVVSFSAAVILVTVKFFAFLVTDSVSLLSSLMDSSFDAIASLVTMLGIIHAASPADEEHRFGHGKIEALAALGQAIFVFGSSVFLVFEAFSRFIQPHQIKEPFIGAGVMMFSTAVTAIVVAVQYYVIRKTSSVAIRADHLHYKGDLLMNISVFIAILLAYYSRWPYFDPLFALIIALVLLWGVKSITREAFDVLLDKELPVEERGHIIETVMKHPLAKAVHDLRTRSTGERVFIEFHLELDGGMTLNRAHDVTEEIEKTLYDRFPKSEVLIHQEPAGIQDHRHDDIVATAK